MSRNKEIVEVNGLAMETAGVEDAFVEDTAQEEEFDGMEEGLDPETESDGEEPGDMAYDADSSGEDTLTDFMEEEDALMESAEDAEEEMPEGDQMEESREQQDMGGEDICEDGEEQEVAVVEESGGMAGNVTEQEDVPAEIAEEPVPAKPKRSSRKKKAVADKAEKEQEAIGEQGNKGADAQPETVPEEELLAEAPLSEEETDSGMTEDFPDMDADYGDDLTLGSENQEDADEWDDTYSEVGEEDIEGTAEEVLEVTAADGNEISAVTKREARPALFRKEARRIQHPAVPPEGKGQKSPC